MFAKKSRLLIALFLMVSLSAALTLIFSFGRSASAEGITTQEYYRRFDTYTIADYTSGVTVTDPSSQAVTINGESFILSKTGVYKLSYPNGNTVNINVYSSIPMSTFTYEKQLQDTYCVREYVIIPKAKIESIIGIAEDYFVTIQLDGAAVKTIKSLKNETPYQITQAGNYKVIYGYVDVFGYITTDSISFTATDEPVISVGQFEQLRVGKSFLLPAAYSYYSGGEGTVTLSITAPDGKVYANYSEAVFTPIKVGVYTFRYSGSIAGETLSKTVEAGCLLYTEDLFAGDSFEISRKSEVDFPTYSQRQGKGVELIGFASGTAFEYMPTVNLNTLTKDDNLISFMPLSGQGYGVLNAVEITLTDVYDKNNKISIFFWQCPWVKNYIYTSVGYSGIYGGVCNEWYDGLDHYNEARFSCYGEKEYAYGALLMNHSFIGSSIASKVEMLSVQLDNDGKIYVSNVEGQYLLRDLRYSQHLNGSAPWEGFTTGEVNIKITLHNMLSKNAGIVVAEMMGQPLGGGNVNDAGAPEIVILTESVYLTKMPEGVKGQSYNIPEISATDIFTASVLCEISLSYKSGLNWIDKASLINGGAFIPDAAGEYRIEYRCTDYFGNSSIKHLNITVNENARPIYSFIDSPGNIVLDKYFKIPEITYSGGSGIIAYEESYFLNGVAVYPDEYRKIMVTETGTLLINVTATDYLGTPYSKTYEVSLVPQQPVLDPGDVPIRAVRGDTINFKGFTAYLFENGQRVDMQTSVTVNGKPLGSGMQYLVDNSDLQLTVVFSAEYNDVRSEKTVIIPVTNPPQSLKDYFIYDDGAVSALTNDNGTVFTVSDNRTITFSNPVAAEDLIIKLTSAGGLTSLNILLTDYLSSDISVLITLKNNNGATDILLSGKTAASLSSPLSNGSYSFIISGNSILGQLGAFIANIEKSENGDKFSGFSSGLVRIDITAETSGSAKIGVRQLANQDFSRYAYLNGDAQGPVIMLNEKNNYSEILFGQGFTVSRARVYDVLSFGAGCRVTVQAPDGTLLLNNIAADKDYVFTANQFGYYTITYLAADEHGNETQRVLTVRVRDTTPPTIINAPTFKSVYKVGEGIQIPALTVTDNLDNNPQAYIFIVNIHGMYDLQKTGAVYTFTEAGNYQIVLFARDATMNVTQIVYTVEVKK